MTTNVLVESPEDLLDTDAACARILKYAAAVGASAWIIQQSFPELTFKSWHGGSVPDLGQSIAGRIFGQTGEVRWIREEDRFRLTWITESGSGIPCYRQDRRYYLMGERIGATRFFGLDRLPYRREYPIEGDIGKDQRAFILVAEYTETHPGFPQTEEEVGSFLDQLNSPAMYAHRFVGTGYGRDYADR